MVGRREALGALRRSGNPTLGLAGRVTLGRASTAARGAVGAGCAVRGGVSCLRAPPPWDRVSSCGVILMWRMQQGMPGPIATLVREAICRCVDQGQTVAETMRSLETVASVLPLEQFRVPKSTRTVHRVRKRYNKGAGSSASKPRRFRSADWTPAEIEIAHRFVSRVHKSGWRLDDLRTELARKSDRGCDKSLSSISKLVTKIMRCTPKRASVVSASQDPARVEAFWRDMYESGVEPDHIVFYDESGLTEKDLEVETGWAPPGKKVKVNRKVTGKSGKRVECMAAICSEGLLVVRFMRGGTIQWKNFRRHIIKHVLPRMNPWPLPRSVLVRPALAHGDVRVPSS